MSSERPSPAPSAADTSGGGPPPDDTAAQSPDRDRDPAIVDPTDRRPVGDWQTQYPNSFARRRQLLEGTYLALLLICGGPVLLFLLWSEHLGDWLGLHAEQAESFRTYGFAWTGGLLGGAVFSMKWLYHSVAHGIWHRDRLIWRLAAPHLSAAFAFSLLTLATSGIVEVIDLDVLRRPSAMVGIAFLLGHFSDLTVARLARTARNLLGTPERMQAASTPEPTARTGDGEG